MSQITDDEIKEDLWNTLRLWDRFNVLDEAQQRNLVEYLFNAHGYLYREEKIKLESP